MPAEPPPPVSSILADRTGQEMALNERYLNPQMGRILRTLGFDKVWTGGEGAHLIDADGERYLDLFGGYGVFAIGRNHPEAIAAVRGGDGGAHRQPAPARRDAAQRRAGRAAARAGRRTASAAMVPANTGTEAVEAAIKIARAATGRPRVLYADHAFHGLTLGSLSINGNEEFREGFGPLLPGCDPVPFGDLDALDARARARRRGGVRGRARPGQGRQPAPARLPARGAARCAARRARCSSATRCRRASGAPGAFLALEHWELEPDMICLAKALSGGLVPIGAVLVSRAPSSSVFDGMERAVRHGSTFGGNDLAAAAALATLRVLDTEGLLERARALGGCCSS